MISETINNIPKSAALSPNIVSRSEGASVIASCSQPFTVGSVQQAEGTRNTILNWFEIVDMTAELHIRELFRETYDTDACCAGMRAICELTFNNLSLESSVVAWLGSTGCAVINPSERECSYMYYQNPLTLDDSDRLDKAFGIFVKTYFRFLENWAIDGWLFHPKWAVALRSLHQVARQLNLLHDIFIIEVRPSLCLIQK